MAFHKWLLEDIDGLWQTATFLQCGDAEEAETLLVSAMASGARRHAANPPAPPSVPLEPHLIRVFLDGVPSGPEEAVVRPGVSRSQTAVAPGRQILPNRTAADVDRQIPVAALHAAAAAIPPWARAAIWLVLIRRWSSVSGLDPEGDFFASIVDETIVEEIGKLGEELRTALVLSDIEGLTYKEIADLMEVPIGTVKSRLFRARRRLQEALYDYAVETGYLQPERRTAE